MHTLTEAVCEAVVDKVYTPEYLAQRLDELVDDRLQQAARDLTSMAVLEWNWPKR